MKKNSKVFFENKKKEYKQPNEKYIVEKLNKVPNKYLYRLVKRLFDLSISLIGIIVMVLPMLVIAILIKKDSTGPVFYKQERLGIKGKPFKIIKFRSMRIDAENNGAMWANKNDSRVTRIGKSLRKTRLDEIPQLFNIFLGQMSFVGPRPERKIFYDQFATYITGFEQRLLIIPGLTGFAQLNGGYDLKPEEKIIYDIEYIKKRSILFDIKLFFKTILIVFSHDGAR